MSIHDRDRRAANGRRFAMAAAALLLVQASAQVPAGPDTPSPGAAAMPDGVLEPKTLKERLSDKASDQQRVDDCGVAPERRGPKPRPDCATDPARSVTSSTR
jgi:hypothetical protein